MGKTWARILKALVVGIAASLVLAGCFSNAPRPNLVEITGVVMAPLGTETSSSRPVSLSAGALLSETPVAGATVIALDFATNKPVGTVVMTDAQGKYSVPNVPAGIDVLVVATKNVRGSKTIRLSTLVSDTGSHAATAGEINAATALSAEAWATKIGKNVRVSAGDFQVTVDASNRVLSRMASVDLSVGGPFLGAAVGAGLANGFQFADEINVTVPRMPDSDVALAKIMIQDIRDAGISVRDAAQTQYEKQKDHFEQVIIPYFEKVNRQLAQLSTNILSGAFIDVPSGTYSEDPYGVLTLTGPAPPNTWIIKTGALTQRVEMTFIDQAGYGRLPQGTISVTSSEDRTLDYHGELIIDVDNSSGSQPRNIVAIRLDAFMKDSVLTNPITLDAALTGTIANGYYTSIGFDGVLTSEVLILNGTATTTLARPDPGLPAFGPWIGVPTSIEVSGDIDTAQMTASGTLRATFMENHMENLSWVVTKTMSFAGDYSDKSIESTTAHGELTFTWKNAETFNPTQPESPANPRLFDLRFKGSVTMSRRPAVEANVTITSERYGLVNCALSYSRGTHAITGTMSMTYDYHRPEATVVIDLTNEKELKTRFTITETPGGEMAEGTVVNARGKTLATLTVEAGMLKINYADGTFETLF